MNVAGRVGFAVLGAASQWYRSAANTIRTRYITDQVALGAAVAGPTELLVVNSGSEGGAAGTFTGNLKASTLQITGASGYIVLPESATNMTCGTLTSASGTASAMGLYMKNNQLIFAHQCGANGTIKYLTITLDGVSCAWVQSATAP